ncbi:hypothetical protein D3C75_721430 [compost metagenome]
MQRKTINAGKEETRPVPSVASESAASPSTMTRLRPSLSDNGPNSRQPKAKKMEKALPLQAACSSDIWNSPANTGISGTVIYSAERMNRAGKNSRMLIIR